MLPEATPWEAKLSEPVVLDLCDRHAIPQVDVKTEGQFGWIDAEGVGHKAAEEGEQMRVAIAQLQRVSVLRTLGPIEHASGLVQRIAGASSLAAGLLIARAPGPT
jgi:hypothetical protein